MRPVEEEGRQETRDLSPENRAKRLPLQGRGGRGSGGTVGGSCDTGVERRVGDAPGKRQGTPREVLSRSQSRRWSRDGGPVPLTVLRKTRTSKYSPCFDGSRK